MRRLYLILGLAIVALGLFHIISTPRIFDELNSRALWFASAGLALILLGTLNLLNWTYGHAARALPWTCATANLVMLIFMALAGSVGGASRVEMLTVLGSLALTMVLSVASVVGRSPGKLRSPDPA